MRTPRSRPPTEPGRSSSRLVIGLIAAMVLAGLLFGWWARGGSESSAPSAKVGDRTQRDRGPSAGGLFSRRNGRSGPTAADVLGALGSGGAGAPASDLVRVEGQVIDAISRLPVPDVEVVFAGPSGEASAMARADGTYQVDVPRGEYRAFVRGDHVISVGPVPWERLPSLPDATAVSAPDENLAPLLSLSTSQKGVDLEVQQSGVVIGVVVDHTGRPVVGAVVRAELYQWRPILGTHIAETAGDGTFRLEIPGGYYDLSAAHPDFAGAAMVDEAKPNIIVYPTMESEVRLTMAAGCVISGRAVRRDGTPAGPGALERGNGVDFWPTGTMADDGSFRWTSVLEEEVTLRAWPWKAPPASSQTLMCKDGARHVVEFVVPDQAPDLTGRIVDASGDGAGGAYIDIYGLTPGAMNQQERADDDGNWAVFSLPAGDYAVTASVPGYGIARARITVPARDLELRLSGTGSLVGKVDGIADGGTFTFEIGGCMSDEGQVNMPPTTRVVPVDRGHYRVDGLPACMLMGWVRTPARTTAVQAKIEAGEVATFDLDLAPPRAKTVRLSVVDHDGNAVVGAQVTAMSMDGRGGAGTQADPIATDARGEASVQAHVGDYISIFREGDHAGPDGEVALIGQHMVSDAPGSVEEVSVTLEPLPTYDP